MHRHLITVFIASACFVELGSAATINLSVSTLAGGNKFVSALGEPLPDGSLVRVGLFSFDGAPNLAQAEVLNGSDFAAIDALFTPLGSENAAAGTGTGEARVGTFFTQPNSVLANINGVDNAVFAAGRQLYVWVFNAATTGAADEWGIFSAASGWNIPNLGSEALASNEISVGYGPGGMSNPLKDGSNNFRLAPIPEPTVPLFGLVGALVFAIRRRR